jgi:outer membrane protein OmpA-like peptidoglycan-associated protein/tetratricopeptide (TPR) repeat protein
MNRISLILFTFLMGLSCATFAQDDDPCQQTMDKNSEKIFKKARDFHKSGKKDEAYELYEEILAEHPEYLEVNYYYALGYYLPLRENQYYSKKKDKSDVKNALAAFNRMFEVCPYYRPYCNLYAAQIAYFNELYPEAVKFAGVIVDNPDLFRDSKDTSKIDKDKIREANTILRKARFYDNILNHPVPFDPHPVPNISTSADEYLGTLSPDGQLFYFTRRKYVTDNSPFGQGGKVQKEFFSCSEKKNGQFWEGDALPDPFNRADGEGSPTINLTNDLLIFVQRHTVKLPGGNYPNYDLYYSEYDGFEWSVPKPLPGKINRNDSWESQPSLSSDGRVLFFASDRPGGHGGSDIWYATRKSDGSWSDPINMGPTINTERNERSPFLHTDSKTLYFSSNGHDGLGGQDIFYSKMDSKRQWSEPVNIGSPINTENDEVDFFVSLDGKTGYFSSNNYGDKDWNIYHFELYEEARPHTMVIVKGKVTVDEGDLENAVVEIRDTNANVVSTGVVSATQGKYAVAAEIHPDHPQPLIVNVKKEGYSFDTQIIKPEEITEEIVEKDAEVKAVETGKVCDLRDIYYETNDFSLTSESKMLLALFIEFLKENPTVKVEIQGHTDNIGRDEDNLLLSENRAKSVYDYVVSQGIPANRLRYKGYGESNPIADNNTAEGRAKNRRTVFLIYEK